MQDQFLLINWLLLFRKTDPLPIIQLWRLLLSGDGIPFQVAECVIVGKNAIDIVCLQSSLEILESVVLHCPGMHVMVQQLVHPKNMIPHLERW